MEKTLLRRKTVLENGVIIRKVCYTKKIVKANTELGLQQGWNIEGETGCTPACPAPTSQGYYECSGGNCIFIPFG